MIGLPGREETAPYYHRYIDRVSTSDTIQELERQFLDVPIFCRNISEEKSLHRYAPDKWSIRQVLSHLNDSERVFVFRAFWFAREFPSPLPSFDQNVAVAAAQADQISFARHVEEFVTIRQGTLSFFRHLPQEAWMRSGTASDNPFTVRSLAYIIAGHVAHHLAILEEQYL